MKSSQKQTLASVMISILILSCECQHTNLSAEAYPSRNSSGMYASDLVEFEDIQSFYKRVFGKDEYTTQWMVLDQFRSATVPLSRIPYQDSWYPERTGGTNISGALAKYDNAFHGGQSKAVAWEVQNHNRLTPNWFGHCNGTGVSAARFQNPLRNVTRPKGCQVGSNGCVEFTPADIRALLAEINMNAQAKFISGNRCRLTQSEIERRPIQRANPRVMDSCDDVNPGSFHVALVNFLGRMKQPIIFDEHQDEEVWNYPIYAYSYTAEGPLLEQEAVTTLRNSVRDANGNSMFPPMDSWIFNPDALSFMHVKLNVAYRNATFTTEGSGTKPAPTRINYEYILELNAEGKVIGGEWLGISRTAHPDFIWMPFEPSEPSGDSSRGNAMISNAEVIKLWAESVGLNPNDPFRDKPRNDYDVRFYPLSDLSWGQVPGYYSMLLDGKDSGAAFLGKKTHLRIEVKEVLRESTGVDVILNGALLSKKKVEQGVVDVLFDSPAGINFLSLRWTSDRVDASEIDADFRYYAM